MARGKKYIQSAEKVVKGQLLPAQEALTKVKELAYTKFDEKIDADIVVGIDPSKGDQTVQGSVVLPHSIGGTVRVLVFAKGEYYERARKAGADYIGLEDLIEKINDGWMDFDVTVATPDVMAQLAKVAKILGPRNLLPNKKRGTVTFDIEQTVADLKRGRVFFRNDKNGIVHFSFGRVSLDADKLQENFSVFMKALISSKPPSSKGRFLRKITVSSTMGVGVAVNPDDVMRY